MTTRDRALASLDRARNALGALAWNFEFRAAAEPPADPANARPDTSAWPTWQQWFHGGAWEPGDNWLYASFTVPAEAEGLSLDGSPAQVHMAGWHPFTLYVDGRLLAQEERPWLSTGPALLPLPEPLQAGRTYQVALRLPMRSHGMIAPFSAGLRVERAALALEEVDTLRAELQVAEALAESDADRAALEAACAALDLDALDARDWERARASFAAAEECLAPLSGRAKAHTIHLMGHSHIDMNWMWTWEDTVACVLRDFHSVAELMRDYPELTFTHSQPPTYQIVQEQAPALWEEVRRRVAEGRWEPVTATWVEGDLNMANGEALARHFLYAIRWSRQVLGVTPTVLWEPDTFGHPGNMPQIARLAGVDRYFHMRCNRALPAWWPVYWWEGIDGSRILCASRVYNGDTNPLMLAQAMQAHRGLGSRHAFHIHGVGDHGGGPVRANMDTVRRLQSRPLIPTLQCGTMDAFLTEVLREGASLPVARGESDTVFEGCYTTHADIKRFNREGENLLLSAEALAALAGTDDRAVMARAWQHVLFNQFHDLLDGSAILPSYDESAEKHAEVVSLAGAATDGALAALAADTDTRGAGRPILVANPLGWARTDLVRVAGLGGIPTNPVLVAPDGTRTPGQRGGNDILFVAHDVPALGHAVYHLVAGEGEPAGFTVRQGALGAGSYAVGGTAPAEAVQPEGLLVEEEAQYFTVETPAFRAIVHRGSGILAGLRDKRAGREMVGYGLPKWGTCPGTARLDLALNVLQIVDEEPHGMTSWQIANVRQEQHLISGATVTLAEAGPVRVVLHVEHTVRASRISQEIVFYRDLDRVDFETVVDWQEVGTREAGVPNLNVAFTARLNRPEAWYETPYAAACRPTDGQEVPALRWADVSGDGYGISVLNDCKYGYNALGSRLRLTLVRSGYDPDPVSDPGEHRFRYSLYPHAGGWREAGIVRQGAGFNQPLLACAVDVHAGSRPAVAAGVVVQGAASVVVSSVKRPEEGEGLIVRLYESQGQAGSVTLRLAQPVAEAEVANLLEETLEPAPVASGAVELAFRPWEIKTVRVR